MKRTPRYFLLLLIAMYANLQVYANGFSVGNWKYELSEVEGSVVLTGFKKASSVMEIPASINYAGKKYDVVKVKRGAFYRCLELNKIIVGQNVTEIEPSAFELCSSLKDVSLPSTLKEFDVYSFYNCDSIQNFYTTGDNGHFYAVDGILYSRDLKRIYAYPRFRIREEVVIPDGVEVIEKSVFANSKTIKNVTLPSTLKAIGYNAFSYCDSLESIVLPDSLYSLAYGAFSHCNNLKNIEIKGTLTNVGQRAFEYTAIDSIVLNANIDVIPHSLFSGCGNLKKVDLPASLSCIEEFAFSGCSSLEYIEIGNNVNSIKGSAFADCRSLKNFDFPSNLQELGYYAFHNCSNLTHIDLQNTQLNHIGNFSFEGCQKLKNVRFPDSLLSIGNNAFASCGKLDSVIIPKSVTSIGNSVFTSDSSLTYIEIPSSVTSVGASVFQDCFSLNSFEIPSSWTSLPSGTFQGCKSLSSIDINKNISEIGSYCFAKCESLTDIVISANIGKISIGCFSGCTKLECITFGVNKYWRDWHDFIESGHLEDDAFESCTSLREVHCLDILPPFYSVDGLKAAFENVDCSKIAFYVPSESSMKYEPICGSLFGSIQEEENVLFNFCNSDGFICAKNPNDSNSLTIIGSPIPLEGDVYLPEQLNYASKTWRVTGFRAERALCTFQNLTSIFFPYTYECIGSSTGDDLDWLVPEFNMFYWCRDLKQITVDEKNEHYFSHRGCLYNKKTASLLHIPFLLTENDTIVRHYSIPEGVKKLVSMNDWFAEGPLKSLSIPSSVEVINTDFFSNALVDTVYIFAKVPPVANYEGNTWLREGDGMRGMNILYVPYGCKSAYEAISEGHINIVEMPNAEPTKVKAKNYTREYGDLNPVFEYELLEGELDGIPNITCVATEKSPAGEYEIVINKGTETNTNVSYENGVLTVVKAPLKVSVGSYEREQGLDNPQFLIEYEGWKLDDGVSILEVLPSVFTDATKDSPCGVYPIVVSGGQSDKYEFEYINGELHIVVPAGIEELQEINSTFDVYSLDGRKIAENVTDLRNLAKGVYIINGKKVVKR